MFLTMASKPYVLHSNPAHSGVTGGPCRASPGAIASCIPFRDSLHVFVHQSPFEVLL